MGFFRTFFGTCCGVEVFRTLREHSWARVVGQLLLLAVICSALIGIGNYCMLKYRWRDAQAAFADDFGGSVYFTADGVRPEQAPEVSRRQEFPYESLLIYVSPRGPEKSYPDETLRDRNFILLWHPAHFMLISRSRDVWNVFTLNPGFATSAEAQLSFPEMKERLLAGIAARPDPNARWNWPPEFTKRGLSTRKLFHNFRLSYSIAEAMFFFLHQLLMIVLCTGFFAAVFRLFSRKKLPDLTFGVVWKVAIYAAFPVLLVVSAFPALQLPGTHLYDQMFILGWAVYLFFVLRYLVLWNADTDDRNKEKTE